MSDTLHDRPNPLNAPLPEAPDRDGGALTTFARTPRPLACSTIFRMYPTSIRSAEQAALEAVAMRFLDRDSTADLASPHVSLRGTGYIEEIDDGRGGLLIQAQYTLGPEELLLLLAVLALAGMVLHNGDRYEAVRSRARTKLPRRTIRIRRAPNGDVEGELSLNCLVAEMGLSETSKNRLRAMVSLARLAGVTCLDLGGPGRHRDLSTGPRLLTFRYTPNPETKRRELEFSLSSRLTEAVIQKSARDGDAVRVAMGEARQLSDGARILHTHLSAVVTQAHEGTVIALSDIAAWIYGPNPTSTHRKRAKEAAAAIRTLDHWAVEDAKHPARGKAPPEIRLDAVRVRRLSTDEAAAMRRKAIVSTAEGRTFAPPLPAALRIRPKAKPRTQTRKAPQRAADAPDLFSHQSRAGNDG